jgi:hypothetical protein
MIQSLVTYLLVEVPACRNKLDLPTFGKEIKNKKSIHSEKLLHWPGSDSCPCIFDFHRDIPMLHILLYSTIK